MIEFFQRIGSAFSGFGFISILEILIIFFLVLYPLLILWENNARLVIWIYLGFALVISLILFLSKIEYAGFFLVALQVVFDVAITVLFSTEVKRAIWNRRLSSDFKHDHRNNGKDASVCIEEIIKAVQNMSKNDVGAIIILSNGNLPNGVLESGVFLNSEISSELIESIFFPKTALHDGAMVLYKNKIQAAGCFLPLAQEVNLSKDLGSRHRAGIGLTETVDVTAIIVSEESGIISIAKSGKLVRYVDTNTLRETLKLFYWQDMIE